MEPNSAAKTVIHTPSDYYYHKYNDEYYHKYDDDDIRVYKVNGRDFHSVGGGIYDSGQLVVIYSYNYDESVLNNGSVFLNNRAVTYVDSKGYVLVYNSVVSHISALGKVTLMDRAVVCRGIETYSEEGCLVKESIVLGEITAKRGPVAVIDSFVKCINALEQVVIKSGEAVDVTIRVDDQRNGANLTLTGEVRNVRVILNRPKPSTPKDSDFYLIGVVSRNYFIYGDFKAGREVKENGQSLRFSSTERVGRRKIYYDLVLTGKNMRYPLTPTNIEFLREHCKEPLDISPKGIITDTHGKFVRVQDEDFNPKCTLEVKGDGIIHGPVVFKNCEGKVLRSHAPSRTCLNQLCPCQKSSA